MVRAWSKQIISYYCEVRYRSQIEKVRNNLKWTLEQPYEEVDGLKNEVCGPSSLGLGAKRTFKMRQVSSSMCEGGDCYELSHIGCGRVEN